MSQSNTTKELSVHVLAKEAKKCATALADLSNEQRNNALLAIADELLSNQRDILAANDQDQAKATQSLNQGEMTQSLFDRLKLDESKLSALAKGIRQIAAMPDPLGKIDYAKELDQDLNLYRVTCPIGLIGVIFEARPEALPQIVALSLKCGDSVILKGGAEAEKSNNALYQCIIKALDKAKIPENAVTLIKSRADVSELLSADKYVDLLIPRGSNSLVRHIQNNTIIPVLGHAEGICHIYVDKTADLAMAKKLILDAKIQYAAACNAVETVLIHEQIAGRLIPELGQELAKANVEIRADESSSKLLSVPSVPAAEVDWSTEYSDLILSLKVVQSMDEAIQHINDYGSGHTETMVSDSSERFAKFFKQVNAAGVYLNASTRFADGFRYGFGAEVGISTNKLHPRGPVGIEGLVTYKYKLLGNGQIVGDYSGKNAKTFTHRDLNHQEKI